MPYKNKETQKKYQDEWSKKNTKGIYIKLCKSTDADILSWLEDQGNKQGYIKELIRADMRDKIIITAKCLTDGSTMTIDKSSIPVV